MKSSSIFFKDGGLAQMVERSLSMREVPGSIPGSSKIFNVKGFVLLLLLFCCFVCLFLFFCFVLFVCFVCFSPRVKNYVKLFLGAHNWVFSHRP